MYLKIFNGIAINFFEQMPPKIFYISTKLFSNKKATNCAVVNVYFLKLMTIGSKPILLLKNSLDNETKTSKRSIGSTFYL